MHDNHCVSLFWCFNLVLQWKLCTFVIVASSGILPKCTSSVFLELDFIQVRYAPLRYFCDSATSSSNICILFICCIAWIIPVLDDQTQPRPRLLPQHLQHRLYLQLHYHQPHQLRRRRQKLRQLERLQRILSITQPCSLKARVILSPAIVYCWHLLLSSCRWLFVTSIVSFNRPNPQSHNTLLTYHK